MSYRRPRFPEDRFLRLPNAWARDGDLKPNAKAILMSILSHDPSYALSVSQLMRETGLGRDAIQAATRHMLERGYLTEVTQGRDDGTGRWGGNDYLVTDSVGVPAPVTADPEGLPQNVRIDPLRVEPSPGEPGTGSPPYKKNPLEKTNERREEPLAELPLDGVSSDPFDEFWTAYPRKVGKDAARRAWGKAARRADPARILAVVRSYPWSPDPHYIPHPATWLNAGRWDDDLAAAATRPASARPTPYRDPPPGDYEQSWFAAATPTPTRGD